LNSLIERHLAFVFPPFFVALWLTVTTILSLLSGWFRLMVKFPNQDIPPILRLRGQSGTMGPGVSLSHILTLSVCRPGLRVGIMRVFGPFCRDFLVPWEHIAVARKTILFWPVAKLQFGSPVIGSLSIPAHIADRLADAALGRWPETGPFPQESRSATLRRLLSQWAVVTGIAALFFALVPVAVAPRESRPPVPVAILFPAVVIGMITIVRYLRERT
jgi:hypothetical protein